MAAAWLSGCSGTVDVAESSDEAQDPTVIDSPMVQDAVNDAADSPPIGACGDGSCDPGEACATCPQDCGPCGGCGNGICSGQEDCASCPADCGACQTCGDGVCDPAESCSACPQDCGACPGCGNGVCGPGESCSSCPADCGACACAHPSCTVGGPLDAACDPCVTQICAADSFCCQYAWDSLCIAEVGSVCGTPCAASCGDGMCSAGESCSSCPADCGACPVCGDGACAWTEDCSTCPGDCGPCPVCGDGTCDWTEDCSTCAADCGACASCGDGNCDPGESCSSCPGDCGSCPACPGNTLGAPPTSTTGSTAGLANALTPACGFSNAPEATYSFTAPHDGSYELNTFGSGYDTVLAVRDGTCSGAELACNDDTMGFQSRVTVTLTAGQTVVVLVDGFSSSQGAYTLNVCDGPCAPTCGDGMCAPGESCSTCPGDCGPCPTCGDGICNQGETCSTCAADCGACAVCGDGSCDPGESCSNCPGDCGACPSCPGNTLGAPPQTATGSTVGLVNALTPTCGSSNAPEATYSFTAPHDGSYEINTLGSGYDTVLAVLDGTCSGAQLACNDDTMGLQSRVNVTLTAGQTVIVVVDGFSSSQGAYTLNVCDGPCSPGCGDGVCDPSESCSSCPGDCGTCANCGDGICSQGETCSSCATDCGSCAVCGDGVCDQGESCASCAGDCGACPACPGTNLGSTVPQTVTGSTAGLVNALPAPCAYSNAPEATYSFTAPADGTYEINTFGSGYDTLLHVHDGTCSGPALACNDDSQSLQSQVFVSLTAGQTIVIVVDGWSVQSGSFTLNIL